MNNMKLIIISLLFFNLYFSNSQEKIFFEVLDFNQNKEVVNGDLKSGEIMFFVAPQFVGKKIKNMEVEFNLPNNLLVYDKDRFNKQPNLKSYSPIRILLKRSERQISFLHEDDIEADVRSGWFYFYVVPFGLGKGKIIANYKWEDETGNKYQGTKESGVISTSSQELLLSANKVGKSVILNGMINYNFDFNTSLPSSVTYIYDLKSPKWTYKNLKNNIDLKAIIPDTYNLTGKCIYNDVIWDISLNNLLISEGEYEPPKEKPKQDIPQKKAKERSFLDWFIYFLTIEFIWG